jgi:hypothetical protein
MAVNWPENWQFLAMKVAKSGQIRPNLATFGHESHVATH